ncbi:MAG: hypothetical protein AAFX98_02365 [Pseudomonadota bacterium]
MALKSGYVSPMAKGSKKQPDREERLRAQLRANLARRKQQTRARREGEGDGRDEGIAASEPRPSNNENKS